MTRTDLLVGRTYFRITYADSDMTMPGVQPLVYIGHIELTDGGDHHAFQDSVSYTTYGSRLLPGAKDREDLEVYFLPDQEIGTDLVDLPTAVELLQGSLARARTLGWPSLPSGIAGAG